MRRHQFTIFVEDAQEYAAVFTSFRRHFGKQKMGMRSLDHNKKLKKLKINPGRHVAAMQQARPAIACRIQPAFLNAGGIIWQSILASGRKEKQWNRPVRHGQ
jgi:hypothetical protein